MFIISIDTLRSDHLPAYGYKRGSTPAIDALRSDSVLFTNVWSPCPLTLPSHTSIFTGQLPPAHGVRDNLGYRLRANAQTIASVLHSRGYGTGAAVSTYILRRETGLNAGFDFYDDALTVTPAGAETSATRPGIETEQALEKWIATKKEGGMFGFLHLYEPHAPYTPPPPFNNSATPYDGEISYADSIVGRFIGYLKEHNLYDDALIVLLSDHGEGLNDHGEAEHGIFLYREALQVPLIIKMPGGAEKRTAINAPGSLIDVFPTIAVVLNVAAQTPGRDLMRETRESRRHLYAESYFGRLHFGWREQRAVIERRFHYIDSAVSELYDYVSDLEEKRSALEDNRRVAAELRSRLPPPSFARPSAVSEEQRRTLQSLGYSSAAGADRGDLPDPKEKIATLHLYEDGLAALRSGNAKKGETLLREFTRANPGMSDGWVALAEAQRAKGDRKGAIASLETAMAQFPENPTVVLNLASALYDAGQRDAARRHLQLILGSDPVVAREMLARMAEESGDFAEAERLASEILERAPDDVDALMTLARLRSRQKRFDAALQLLDRAAGVRTPPPRGVDFERGMLLLNLQRGPEAVAALEREVQNYPDHLKAWGNLAVVMASQGRNSEARRLIAEATRRNPGAASQRMAREVLATVGK